MADPDQPLLKNVTMATAPVVGWISTRKTTVDSLSRNFSLFGLLFFARIRDFHIAKREQDIGYYARFVGSSFMFGRALTSVFWGMIADRIGRKPVIISGTIAVAVFNTLTNFWMAIGARSGKSKWSSWTNKGR